MDLPAWLRAGLWGGLAGGALIVGAIVGYYVRLPRRLVATVMAFGSGVLISAVAFELMDEALKRGGFAATAGGFVAGAAVYTAVDVALARRGARHRKRSSGQQPSESETSGSGLAIAAGALLDGIPESVVIGVGLLGGRGVGVVTVIAVFLSNIPEGLSSAVGMRHAGRSPKYVFGVWCGVASLSALASLLGYVVFGGLPPETIAATTAVAAGAILAMLTDTMIPEAFEATHDFAGLVTVLGFLAAFALSKLTG